jgi:hypothetical protein
MEHYCHSPKQCESIFLYAKLDYNACKTLYSHINYKISGLVHAYLRPTLKWKKKEKERKRRRERRKAEEGKKLKLFNIIFSNVLAELHVSTEGVSGIYLYKASFCILLTLLWGSHLCFKFVNL